MNQAQMLKGILEGCVLKIVEHHSRYSQEIVQLLRRQGFADISEGTLFPLLLRQDKEGYFTIRMVSSAVGPSRKYYQLNQAGLAALNRFYTDWENLKSIVDHILTEEA